MDLKYFYSRDLLNAACGMSSYPTIIDIRSEVDFSISHVGASANLDLSSTTKSEEAVSEKIFGNSRTKSPSGLAIIVSDEKGFEYFPLINKAYSSKPIFPNLYFLKNTYDQFKQVYSHACSDDQLLKSKVQLSTVPCEIIPGLFLGQMCNTKNAAVIFKALGITHILNCTLKGEVLYDVPSGVEMKQILIDDERAEEYPLEEGLAFLKRAVDQGAASASAPSSAPSSASSASAPSSSWSLSSCSSVRGKSRCFVHCSMGISRSATIVIAYLMWRYGLSARDALLVTRTQRRPVLPNPGFTHQLLAFEQRLRTDARIPMSASGSGSGSASVGEAKFDLKQFTNLPPATEVDKIIELGIKWKQEKK